MSVVESQILLANDGDLPVTERAQSMHSSWDERLQVHETISLATQDEQ